MTKRDFQEIAAAVYSATQTQAHEDARLAAPSATGYLMAHVIQNIARAMAERNPRFDRERFIEACETGKCRGMRQVNQFGITPSGGK